MAKVTITTDTKPSRRRKTKPPTFASFGEFVTLDEMASVMRISKYMAAEMVRTGQVPSIRCGQRLIRVPVEALRKLAKSESEEK